MIKRRPRSDKIDIQMTPMIDIVFQLLTFFIMSFKIQAVEGDFSVKMPLAAPSAGKPDDVQLPPIRVRLAAGQGGELASIKMGERSLPNFAALHNEIIGIVGRDTGPGTIAEQAEVEFDCDYDLRYEHVISAISAVSGYIDNNQRIVKLIEKIKFAPPRGPGT
jgi:biopolymer transport protein ExbD